MLRVQWAHWSELLRRMKATRSRMATERLEDVIHECAVRPHLLILDDLRPLHGSQDDENLAYEIVKARDGRDFGRKRSLIFASANVTTGELGDILGPAAWDRFRHKLDVITCDWPSYRLEKGEQTG